MRKLICLVVWFGMVVGVQAKEIIIKKSTESIKDVTPVVKKVEYKEVCDFCGHIFCHKKLYQNKWYDIDDTKAKLSLLPAQKKEYEKILKSEDYFGNNESGIYCSTSPLWGVIEPDKYILKIDIKSKGGIIFNTISHYYPYDKKWSEHKYDKIIEICPACYKKYIEGGK